MQHMLPTGQQQLPCLEFLQLLRMCHHEQYASFPVQQQQQTAAQPRLT
jgi:hypothetical protein